TAARAPAPAPPLTPRWAIDSVIASRRRPSPAMNVARGEDFSGPSTLTNHCRPTFTSETVHASPAGRGPIPARTAASTTSFSSLVPPAQRIFRAIASRLRASGARTPRPGERGVREARVAPQQVEDVGAQAELAEE